MPRECAAVKGRRYLAEGRLRVESLDRVSVLASCRGMGETYRLGYRRGGWWCECPAASRCSHLTALMLVVDRPGAAPHVSEAVA